MMRIYKKLAMLIFLFETVGFCSWFSSIADGIASVPKNVIAIMTRYIPLGTSYYRNPTISKSEFEPAQASGKVVSNVNIFNGQPYYNIPLERIGTANGISWNVSLSYYGGVQPIIRSTNETSPTGIVGLGWYMETPYVAINHHGTVSATDDMLYCNLGPYGGGQILQNADGQYFVSSNPYIAVIPTISEGKFESWMFVMPDGNKMFFGMSENSRRIQLSLGNVIVAHPESVDDAKDFVYRFDLSKVSDFTEKNSICFEYNQEKEFVSETKYYVRASALSAVYWKNKETTIDSIVFLYKKKNSDEYLGYATTEPKDSQRLFETKYLDKMQSFSFGNKIKEIQFDYSVSSIKLNIPKRILKKVTVGIVGGESKSWLFDYDPDNGMLSKVESPSKVVERFEYEHLKMVGNAISSNGKDVMRAANGQEVVIDSKSVSDGKYGNGASCTDEFCYTHLIDARNDKKKNFYLQVYHNEGNYFKNEGSFSIEERANPTYRFSKDYFIIADIGGRYLDFYEWTGTSFEKRNDELDDFFKDSLKLNGTIENVYAEENYALIEEKDGNNYRVYPIVKNIFTGKWTLLNKTKNGCTFANVASYGETVRNVDSDACLEWNSEIFIGLSNYFFIVGDDKKDVLNVFAFVGGNFKEISFNRHLFPDFGIQLNSNSDNLYSVNFQKNLEDVKVYGNIVILSLNKDGDEYIAILYYDGNSFKKMAYEKWNDGEHDRGVDAFYVENNYIIEVSRAKSNVYVWRKTQIGDELSFKRDNTGIFQFDGKNHYVFVSTSKDAFYLEERSAAGIPIINKDRYHHKLMKISNDPSVPLVDFSSQLDVDTYELQFSSVDPVVFFKKLRDSENSSALCYEKGKTCTPIPYSRHRQFMTDEFFDVVSFNETDLQESYESTFDNDVYSQPNRLIIRSIVNKRNSRNSISYAQYYGSNYHLPFDYPVVKKYWKETGVERFNNATSKYVQFDYIAMLLFSEFNANSQSAQFANANVVQYSADGSVLSSENFRFNVDAEKTPLVGFEKNLQGTEINSFRSDAGGWGRLRKEYSYYVDFGINNSWPKGLVVNRLEQSITEEIDDQMAKFESHEYHRLLDKTSGQFCGTLNVFNGNTVLDQLVLQSQRFDNNGYKFEFRVPIMHSKTVRLSETDAPLSFFDDLSCEDNLLFVDSIAEMDRFSYSKTIPFLKTASYKWQPIVRSGKGFNPYEGFVLTDTLISTNEFNQLVEKKSLTNVGLKSSCFVYEGYRSLMTAIFSGASCSDVAATTAEHGNLNGWEMASTSLDSVQVYDGLYSFKVVDGYGPTKNISLKELKRYKYDFVISAYGYSTKNPFMLVAEFRKADKSILKVLASYAPVNEPFMVNKWQRYELEIPYDTLVADGMFADVDEDDHLRIWMGYGKPRGDDSRIGFVDDFVAFPTSSSFQLNSYDRVGLNISTLNNNFQKKEFVYDRNYVKRAVRDDQGRLFNDNAFHLLNENVGAHNE